MGLGHLGLKGKESGAPALLQWLGDLSYLGGLDRD